MSGFPTYQDLVKRIPIQYASSIRGKLKPNIVNVLTETQLHRTVV